MKCFLLAVLQPTSPQPHTGFTLSHVFMAAAAATKPAKCHN